MVKRNQILENVLLVADIIVALILLVSFVMMIKCDTFAKSKAEIRTEKSITSYAKKHHKAKGIRIVGERGATKNVLKYAAKKQKGKNAKYYKKSVCEKFRVEIIDQFGAYTTCKYKKSGVIDGVRDDWTPGIKVWVYNLYNWKTKKYDRWFIAE